MGNPGVLSKSEAADHVLKFHQEEANKGNAYYQFRMGQRYLIGDGVEKDTSKACDMFLKAAAQGNEEAKAALQKLKP
jgi:TPR repeat protein